MRHRMRLLAALTAVILWGCASTVRVPGEQSLYYALADGRNSPSVITHRTRGTFEADSAACHADSIALWLDGTVVAEFPLDSVAIIFVRHNGVATGLEVGFLMGAGTGAVYVLGSVGSGGNPGLGLLVGGAFGVIGGLTGALLGGLAGSWTEYDLTDNRFSYADTLEPQVTILAPALEYEDEELVTFVWKGKVVWLRKERLTFGKAPQGILITMPTSVRAKLE